MNNEKNKTSSEVVLKIDGLSKGYKMFARKKDRIIETLFPIIAYLTGKKGWQK